jgi:2-C-methyl-D-erythritol 4-phosphate cytidylyltransferase / 2-C-methyl-D-erythritol 2,4-cyclodiphosphate synthase
MGHSDADVVLHALTDAIYGSIGDGDIGEHFPPSDIRWTNANSEIFLKHSISRLLERNGSISNIDITIICEEPKMSKYKPIMVDRLSELVDIETDKISVKATTTENLGFTGRREGIAAQCIVTITMQI